MKFKLDEDLFLEANLGELANDPEYQETQELADKVLNDPVTEDEPGQMESILNRLLVVNKRQIARGGKQFVNVLFEGPAGSGNAQQLQLI